MHAKEVDRLAAGRDRALDAARALAMVAVAVPWLQLVALAGAAAVLLRRRS